MNSRIASLDGLRAISIVLVLLAHLTGTKMFPFDSAAVHIYANLGVRIFFVISGFLITSLLVHEYDKSGNVSLSNFYLRRAFRILPAAYLYMFVIAIGFWSSLHWSDLIAAFAYFNNFSHQRPWVLGHLWSLSNEEQFYLLWPFAFRAFPHRRIHIAAATVVAGPILRVGLWLCGLRWLVEYSFPAVADALATGCLLALLQPQLKKYHYIIASGWFWAIPILTFFLPLTDLRFGHFYRSLGLTLVHVGISLSIQHAIQLRLSVLNFRPIVWIGKMSYSLYLWQEPFLNRTSQSISTAFPLNLLLAFGFGTISYYCIEKPFLRLRESHLSPSRRIT